MADEFDIEDEDTGLPDGEDDLTATLREQIGKISAEDGDDDDGGFDAPLDDDAIEQRKVVNEEDGVKRIQEARDKKSAPEKTPKAKASDKDQAKDAQPAVTDDEYTAAIGGLPAAVQERIKAQKADYDAVMAPFKGRERQFEAMGIQPKDAVEWFVNVNDYAQRDPAGYMAWVVGQASGGDSAKTEEVLQAAAAKLGYRVERDTGSDEDDEDEFMSDRERELLEENRRLKAAQQPQPQFGPDSPAEQSRRDVMAVISEVDAQGNPLRPHFETLQPMILEIVKRQVQETGRAMTQDDLRSAYEQAELAHPTTRDVALQRLIDQRSAAQAGFNVPQRGQQDAASLARAKNASTKIIDGPGQGAGPQPAAEDASLDLEAFLRKQFLGGS